MTANAKQHRGHRPLRDAGLIADHFDHSHIAAGRACGANASYIARYSGGAWWAFAHNGLDGVGATLAMSGSNLFVGGNFAQSNDGTVKNNTMFDKKEGKRCIPNGSTAY